MTTYRRSVSCALLTLLVSGCEQRSESDTSAQPDGDTDTELPEVDAEPDETGETAETDETDTPPSETDPSIFRTGVCLHGWCFEQPLPFGPRMLWPQAFWAASPDEAWAVLDKTLVHWKDNRWTVVGGEDGSDHPTVQFAVPLDGTARDNVVVATADGAMHFDGDRWTAMVDCPRPASVWVAGPDDVWLASVAPRFESPKHTTLHRWNGASCTALQTFEFAEEARLDGSDPDHGWLALRFRPEPPPSTTQGQLLKWDGSAWTSALELDLFWDLTAVSADLAFLVDVAGTQQWDGARWSRMTDEILGWFWFASESDGWATTGRGAGPARSGSVRRWDGATWTTVRTESDYPIHLHGAGPDTVLAVLEGGRGAVWDGETWAPTMPSEAPLDLLDIAVGPTGEAWAVARDGLLRGVGGAWTLVAAQGGTIVWSGAEGEVWVGDEAGLERWADGWSPIELPAGVGGEVVAIWGTSPEQVFVATDDRLNLWNGQGWAWSRAAPASIGRLKAIHGSGPDDVWVVGASGLARVASEGFELADLPTCYGGTNGPIEGELVDLWVDTPGHPLVVNEGSYVDFDAIVETMTLLQPGEEGWTCEVHRNGLREIRIAACDGQVRVAASGELGYVDGWRWISTWIGGRPGAITCAPYLGFWVAGRGGMIAHRPPAAR